MTTAYQVYTASRQLLEAYAAAMQPLCHRVHMAPTAVDILLFLANNPGRDTARDICTYRGLKPGLVSFHVERLVQEGYLQRRSDPNDRRRSHLLCTDRATPLIRQGRAAQEDFFRRMTAGLAPDELAVFRRCLDVFRQNLADIQTTEEEQA